jgi:hypothetical protein
MRLFEFLASPRMLGFFMGIAVGCFITSFWSVPEKKPLPLFFGSAFLFIATALESRGVDRRWRAVLYQNDKMEKAAAEGLKALAEGKELMSVPFLTLQALLLDPHHQHQTLPGEEENAPCICRGSEEFVRTYRQRWAALLPEKEVN